MSYGFRLSVQSCTWRVSGYLPLVLLIALNSDQTPFLSKNNQFELVYEMWCCHLNCKYLLQFHNPKMIINEFAMHKTTRLRVFNSTLVVYVLCLGVRTLLLGHFTPFYFLCLFFILFTHLTGIVVCLKLRNRSKAS